MLYNLQSYFLLFILYSFIGWCIEVVVKLYEYKRFINRGFLIGPYLPIYGFGALLITFLLDKYKNDLIVLFIFSILICSILEYFTSFFMEKIFHARWWDYSKKKFNINGRIYLGTMIPFGILGIIMIKFINPFLYYICDSCNKNILNIISLIILIVFITDIVFSTIILISVRKENKLLEGDNTEKMSKKVYNKLLSLGWPYRRLLKAFPNVYKLINESKKNALRYINKKRQKYLDKEKKLIEKSEEKIGKIHDKYNEKIDKLGNKLDKIINKK